jgi:hypothetical protein
VPEATALPRRRPGASGINEALTTEPSGTGTGTGWKEFFRLRNPAAK